LFNHADDIFPLILHNNIIKPPSFWFRMSETNGESLPIRGGDGGGSVGGGGGGGFNYGLAPTGEEDAKSYEGSPAMGEQRGM
jgi:hypothetical protein